MSTKEICASTGFAKMRHSFNIQLIFISRIGIGGLFILSGLSKVLDLSMFAGVLRQYVFLPDWTILYLALLIPAVEYGLGVCLLFGQFLRKAILILLGMIFMFSGALLLQIFMGNNGSCGCFGNLLPEIGGWWALGRNGLIIIWLIVLFFSSKKFITSYD